VRTRVTPPMLPDSPELPRCMSPPLSIAIATENAATYVDFTTPIMVAAAIAAAGEASRLMRGCLRKRYLSPATLPSVAVTTPARRPCRSRHARSATIVAGCHAFALMSPCLFHVTPSVFIA